MLNPFWSTYIQGFFIVMAMLTIVWIVSVRMVNAGIVDPFWGLGFVLVNAFYFFNTPTENLRKWILLALVSIWGLRLFAYLWWRNWGKPEDYRYAQFRQRYGATRYWWFSFFQVFLLQGILLWMISAPLFAVNYNTENASLTFWDALAILCWIIGFAFEAGGDYQLVKFKSNPANKGKVLNTGFWKYTRHPNYFGDACVWWGFAFFSMAVQSYWSVLGSLLMTFLLVNVSGVALLEKALKTNKPQYDEYIRKTSSFFPWFPKK